jgi:hypothetical protein
MFQRERIRHVGGNLSVPFVEYDLPGSCAKRPVAIICRADGGATGRLHSTFVEITPPCIGRGHPVNSHVNAICEPWGGLVGISYCLSFLNFGTYTSCLPRPEMPNGSFEIGTAPIDFMPLKN